MIYTFRKGMKRWRNILWVVLASFVFASLSSVILWRTYAPAERIYAYVNGRSIPFKRFEQELSTLNRYITQLEQYARSQNVPLDLFLDFYDLGNREKRAFDTIVHETLIDEIGASYDIVLDSTIKNDELAKSLPSTFFSEQGTLNPRAYKHYIFQMGMTISEFESRQEKQMKRSLLEDVIKLASYTPGFKQDEKEKGVQKSFIVTKIPYEHFVHKASKDDIPEEALKTFYHTHSPLYYAPEKRKFLYWELDPTEYEKEISVHMYAAEKYYEKNKSKLFRVPPRVKVRKILLVKDETHDGVSSLHKAQELHAELIQTPEKFTSFVKKFSQAKETVSKDGIVDFFEKGTHDPVFEREAFKLMSQGEISPVITTRNGHEILQLVERIPAYEKPFDEVKDEIIGTLKANKALRMMKSDINTLLASTSHEHDTLEIMGGKKKIPGKKTKWLTQDDTTLASSLEQKIAFQSFSPRNKKAATRGSFSFKDTFIVYRLHEKEKSFRKEFDDVADDVKKDYINDKARKDIKQAAHKIKKVFFSSQSAVSELTQDIPVKEQVTDLILHDQARTHKGYAPGLLQEAFILTDPEQLFIFKHENDYYLIQLKEMMRSDTDKKEIQEESQEAQRLYYEAFIASLQRTATIEKLDDIGNTTDEML